MSDATPTPTAPTDAAPASSEAAPARVNARKLREGIVTSASMDKTIVVTVTESVRHPKYRKTMLQSKKLHTHDETNDARVGDRVRVAETRPLSKTKRWRLVEVLERAR
jgi:small subunit ribosomal protein S17